MRWILTLLAMAAGAWYLSNRQRRARLQQTLQTRVPPEVKARGDEIAATARATVETARTQAQQVAAQAAETARTQAQQMAAQAVEAARTQVQQVAGQAAGASGTIVEKAQQVVESARRTVGDAATSVQESAGAVADRAGEAAQSGVESVAEAPPADEDGAAPEGQGARPIAGQTTTTVSGSAVDALSPVGESATSTGQPEPLPEGLAPGDPGTGGPAGSARAPSTPDSTETPTTGMEQPPVVDRAAEVAERTSGAFIGNKNTRIFHTAESSRLPGEKNRVYFESAEEAIAAGFSPAEGEDIDEATS